MKYPFNHIKNNGDNIRGLLNLLYAYLGEEEYYKQVIVNVSSNYSGSVYDKKAIDFNRDTMWSGKEDDKQNWLYVKLPFPFYLEGYTIQTANQEYHPKSWYFSASNDAYNWTEEIFTEDTNNVMKNGQYKSLYVKQEYDIAYSFYKVRFGSSHFTNAPRFDIAQIEFFGKPFLKMTCFHRTSEKHILIIIFILNTC